jgi:ABC-type glycerol-3-phosphate transport system substrate-binding protein
MKYAFIGAFLFMGVLSVLAVLWTPQAPDDRIPLVWGSDDNPMRHEQMALFNAMQDDYRVELDPQNMEKVVVQCMGGIGPDFFSCYTPEFLNMLVRAGVVMDLTEEFAARGIDPKRNWPALMPYVELDGSYYGLPDNTATPAIFYNKGIFDEEGIAYPQSGWTWEEMVALAERLTKRDKWGRPIRFGLMSTTVLDWRHLLPNWGAAPFTPEGTRCMLDTPEAIEAIGKVVYDPLYVNRITPTPVDEVALASAGGWGTGPIAQFGMGKGAMAIGARWWLCLLRNEAYKDLRLGAVAIPKAKTGLVYAYGKSTVINANCKNKEGALRFMEYMHSREWTELLNRQADALGPMREYCYTEEYLFNPDYPNEDYNQVFLDGMENSLPLCTSPYINGQRYEIITNKYIDFIRTDIMGVEEALTKAAREVNEEIVELLRVSPDLYERYRQDLAKGALPAWDNQEDAP